MTVAIRSLNVPREHRLIAQGQSVTVIAVIANVALTSVLLNPSSVPLISVYNPSGVAVVTDQPMVQQSVGTYLYNLLTTAAMPVGIYTATVTAVHLTQVARVEDSVIFKITTVTTFVSFGYLVIQDQTGVLWYWHVAADNTLDFTPAIPVVTGKQASQIAVAVVPHWLEIDNAGGSLRYVYPEVDGTITVSATEPATGSGVIGSPTFGGVSGGDWEITLNISDEVVLNEIA